MSTNKPMTTDDERNPWVTVSTDVAYSNSWITVHHHEVIRPDGNPGVYGLVHYKNRAVAIVPIDENGDTWLVGQYRYTTNSYSWEVPEGGVPFDEDLEDGALRELKEETGLSATNLIHLGSFYLSNSVTDEIGHVLVATGLSQGEPDPDGTEQLVVRKVSLKTALDMVDDGTIHDGFAVTALLKVDRWMRTNTAYGHSAT